MSVTESTLAVETADAPCLLRSDAEGIATLTLSRPQARNALSEALIDALQAEFDAISRDPGVKVLILTAGQGRVFCAGHDLKEMTARRADPDRGRAYFADVLNRCSRMMQSIVLLPQPVIAAVEGVATAAGCQIVASCDLAVAGDGAGFCTPGVHIGLFCSTPMVPLSRNLSRKHAMEMLLTGETLPASEALRMGLLNRVVPRGQAMREARRFAKIIASKAPAVVKIGKRAFYDQAEMNLAGKSVV